MANIMIDWNRIDSVFLDMDGTLLDLHFDNHFWREHVPRRYAEARGLSIETAKAELLPRYRDLEGTLDWYCVDHWSRELGLDIALLKQEVGHLIAVHPHVVDFLEALAALGKRRVLVTNAHQKSLGLKLERTQLGGHFERILSAHDLGAAKEAPIFGQGFRRSNPSTRRERSSSTTTRACCMPPRPSASSWLIAVMKPDSKGPRRTFEDFPAIDDFSALLPSMPLPD